MYTVFIYNILLYILKTIILITIIDQNLKVKPDIKIHNILYLKELQHH